MMQNVVVGRDQHDVVLHVVSERQRYWNVIVTGATPVPRVVAHWFETVTGTDLSLEGWNDRSNGRMYAEPVGSCKREVVLWFGCVLNLRSPAAPVTFCSTAPVPGIVVEWLGAAVAIEVIDHGAVRVLSRD